jgi:prophage tail gpP-like protein
LKTDVALVIGDRRYRGWSAVRVTRGIDAIAGAFELSIFERWSGQQAPWPIFEGDACSILLAGETLITGFVDKVDLALGPGEHSITISGRDATGDLVDCSARLDRWEFRNTDVLALARKIAAPYGISVSLQPGLPASTYTNKKKHSIDPGDSAANAIETACRIPGLLPVSDGLGGLVLVQAGNTRCPTELVEGENILAGRASFDLTNRFRTYFVLGSHSGVDSQWRDQNTEDPSLDDSASAVERVTSVRGSAQDPNVRTGRVLFVRPESSVTATQARTRAQWEATVRAARGVVASVTVQGWVTGDDKPWPTNSVVRVRSSSLRLNGDMLVIRATHNLGPDGSTTQLDLGLKDSFKPQPEIPPSSGLWTDVSRGVPKPTGSVWKKP